MFQANLPDVHQLPSNSKPSNKLFDSSAHINTDSGIPCEPFWLKRAYVKRDFVTITMKKYFHGFRGLSLCCSVYLKSLTKTQKQFIYTF